MEQIRAMKSLFRATMVATRGIVRPLISRRNGVPEPAASDPAANRSYSAIAVRPCRGACDAALKIAHNRLLKREAPAELPLPGCTNTQCRCRLEAFEDRRAADERRQRLDDTASFDRDENRRSPGDRRINKQRARATSYFNDY